MEIKKVSDAILNFKKIINNKIEPPKTSDNTIKEVKNNEYAVKVETEDLEIKTEYIDSKRVPNNDWIFDESRDADGEFGGNQGALIENIDEWIDDPKIMEIAKNYYPDITKEDLELLFYRMNSIGCGYIAAVNMIMLEYIFHSEADFREKFGFDLYTLVTDENGKLKKDFNYEYLFLDFFLYCAKENGYETIQDVYGNTAEEMEYRGRDAGDSALDPYENNREGQEGTIFSELLENISNYLENKDISVNVQRNEIPMHSEDWYKRKEELERIQGFEIPDDTVLYYEGARIPIDLFNTLKNEGKNIIIGAENFSLYSPEDIDGNGQFDDVIYDNVGSHAMAVVGTTEDGKVIVSSWGHEYIMNLEDVSSFLIVDFDEFRQSEGIGVA